MSVNLDEMDVFSPEYEAAMEAAQAEEDEATGNVEAVPNDSQAEDGEAIEAAPTATDEAKTEPEPAPKVAGVASKDGSRVLPYAALQAARREAAQAKQERDEARRLIEDLKAGKQPESNADPFSDEAIADLSADIPLVGEIAKALKQTREELAALRGNKDTTEAEPKHADDPVQEAIDAVPLLSEWQATDAEKFGRAQEIDRALQNSPKWRGKPLEARFDEVARMVADEYGVQTDSAPPTKQPTPNRANPREVINSVRRAPPNTLSDFKGGGSVDATSERLERMPVNKAFTRMQQMTDAEIDAHLAKFG